jgi:hypothetical protein
VTPPRNPSSPHFASLLKPHSTMVSWKVKLGSGVAKANVMVVSRDRSLIAVWVGFDGSCVSEVSIESLWARHSVWLMVTQCRHRYCSRKGQSGDTLNDRGVHHLASHFGNGRCYIRESFTDRG